MHELDLQNLSSSTHQKTAEKDKGAKVKVGHVHAAVGPMLVGLGVAHHAGHAGKHNPLPGFTGGASKQHQQGGEEGAEIAVPVDFREGIQFDVAKYLKMIQNNSIPFDDISFIFVLFSMYSIFHNTSDLFFHRN